LFGDVAVTHYFWPEADQSSPTVFRITHTWQKGPAGWHIIGGMSCGVPRSGFNPAVEQQEVLKASQAWRDALNRRDLDAVGRYLDDDFLGSADDGVFLNKARLLKRLEAHTPEEEQRGDVQDVRVRVEGDSAVVNYLVAVRESCITWHLPLTSLGD